MPNVPSRAGIPPNGRRSLPIPKPKTPRERARADRHIPWDAMARPVACYRKKSKSVHYPDVSMMRVETRMLGFGSRDPEP